MQSEECQKLIIETINDICLEVGKSKPMLTKNLFPKEVWKTFSTEDRRIIGREVSRLASLGHLPVKLSGKNAANHNQYICA